MSKVPVPVPKATQKQLLAIAKREIKKNAFLMKCHWDSGNIMDTLKSAAAVCSELRTSALQPDTYYALCNFHPPTPLFSPSYSCWRPPSLSRRPFNQSLSQIQGKGSRSTLRCCSIFWKCPPSSVISPFLFLQLTLSLPAI